MKTLRAKRQPQAQPELEILTRLGLHLLELAGSAPTQFVTVAQLASWLGCDRETIRRKIRHRLIEAHFDRRFAQYAIPVAEAERVLAERGLSVPNGFASAQTPLALVGGTDVRRSDRKAFATRTVAAGAAADQTSHGPVEAAAKAASELAAEEAERHRLEAKREKLAVKERAAAEHLAELQAALDEVSGKIDSLLASRPGSTQGRVIAGAMRPGTLHVRRAAQRAAETFRSLLAEGGLGSLTAEEFVGIFRTVIEGQINPQPIAPVQISLEQYLGLAPPPSHARSTKTVWWGAWKRHAACPAPSPRPKTSPRKSSPLARNLARRYCATMLRDPRRLTHKGDGIK